MRLGTPTDWLTQWLINWLTNLLINSLIRQSINQSINQSIDHSSKQSFKWFYEPLIDAYTFIRSTIVSVDSIRTLNCLKTNHPLSWFYVDVSISEFIQDWHHTYLQIHIYHEGGL